MTQRQLALLRFIETFIADHEYAPSFPEMMEGVGEKSKSSISRLLTSLEEQGRIRRLHNRSRAIEVVKDPELPVAHLSTTHLRDLARAKGLVLCHVGRDEYGGRVFIPVS